MPPTRSPVATAPTHTQGTAVVQVFDMTAGGTGLTETSCVPRHRLSQGLHHQNGHAAYYPGTAPLFLKLLFAPADGKLLGAQVLGWDGVDKRIDVLAVALRAGMTVFDLEHLELAYAPPYGAAKDPVNMAGFLGANLLRGDIDLWYAEDYPECADRVTILDTRTQAEYDAWHIPGAVLIPYTELRERLDEVPRDKPVYTYCRSGFRSYIAYCVLKQNGWDDVGVPGRRHDDLPRLPSHAVGGRHGRHAGGGPRRGPDGAAGRGARACLTPPSRSSSVIR